MKDEIMDDGRSCDVDVDELDDSGGDRIEGESELTNNGEDMD